MKPFHLLLLLLFIVPRVFAATATDYYNAGSKLSSDKQFNQAIKYYDAAIKLEPKNAAALMGRANCYYTLKLYSHALTDYRMALALQPQNTEVRRFVKELRDKIESAPRTITWLTPAEGMAESLRTQKPILYDITAEWCHFCVRLEKEVFEDGGCAARINLLFVTVRVLDRKREDGKNTPDVAGIEAKYKVTGFPTLVIQHPERTDFTKHAGYAGKSRTMVFLNKAAQ